MLWSVHGRRQERVFKTAWFSKAAKRLRIRDDELCAAIERVMLGQADNLNGGVFKKRLGKSQYRSVVVARGRRHWVTCNTSKSTAEKWETGAKRPSGVAVKLLILRRRA